MEVDTTFYHDCRHLPTVATVCLAIKRGFGDDDDRRVLAPRRSEAGVWRIESGDLNRYKGVDTLVLEGANIAKVTLRRERVQITESGRVQRRQEHSRTDLLVTMRYADSFPLNKVSDDDIIEAIVNMNIGTTKWAPQKQFDRTKNEYSGNKIFVLANVAEADRGRIPNELSFDDDTFGKLSIGLSHKYQIRFCNFCGKRHDAVCQVRLKVEEMKKRREANLPVQVLSLIHI